MFFKQLTSSLMEQRTSGLHFGQNSPISSIHGTTLALLFVVPLGCQSLGGDLNKNSRVLSKGHTILKEHVIMFDEDGYPLDPTGNSACIEKTDTTEISYCEGKHHFLLNYPRFTRQDFNRHVQNIIASAREQAKAKGQDTIKLLFFVHGGLNTQVGSIDRIIGEGPDSSKPTQSLYDLITTETDYYPIFINWQSSLRASYFDHLFYIRQGEKWPPLPGWLSAPIVLAVDIGRSILRAPLVWGGMVYNDAKTAPALQSFLGNERILPDEVAKQLLCQDAGNELECQTVFDLNKAPQTFSAACWADSEQAKPPSVGPGIIIGSDERQCPEMGWKFFQWLVTIPTKLLISPFLDAFGKSAWDNMLRSIQLLFQLDEEYHLPASPEADATISNTREARGGLSIFLKQLSEAVHEPAEKSLLKWEITWIGHSAGTIILNEIVRQFGLPQTNTQALPFNNIVYMAAASTLRDLGTSVYPYLQIHPTANYYHLMLHEKAEEGERVWEYFDLPPRGSLLVWIDDFLYNPLTHQERTAGAYSNFFSGFHSIPEDIRDQIHIRVFSQGQKVYSGNPEKHGEFTTRFKFWDEVCWSTAFDQVKNDCIFR